MRDYIIQMSKENSFWEKKYEKYYRKLAKLKMIYDKCLESLQSVQIFIKNRLKKRWAKCFQK